MQQGERFQMKQKRFEDAISRKRTRYSNTQFFNISLTIYVVRLSMRPMALNRMIGPVALEKEMKLIQTDVH